jgi:xanthosine utilization system XapX-like protein
LTLTIRRSTAIALIGMVGLLAGLAIGGVSQALSSGPTATVSLSTDQTLREIREELREIHRVEGNSQGVFNILGELKHINRNTR